MLLNKHELYDRPFNEAPRDDVCGDDSIDHAKRGSQVVMRTVRS